MKDVLRSVVTPIPGMPAWKFYLRCAWIVVQIVAAYCLANQVNPFFYQRF